MPRVIGWKRILNGAMLRTITVTWSRDEVLARVMAVPTFKHKRLIVKDWRANDTL